MRFCWVYSRLRFAPPVATLRPLPLLLLGALYAGVAFVSVMPIHKAAGLSWHSSGLARLPLPLRLLARMSVSRSALRIARAVR